MNYDKQRRRWRAMYKGKRLSVRVSDLGGTGRDDTLVAANRWYRAQVEQIDRQQADSAAIFRPNEAEYLQNMESLFSSVTALKTLKDKNLDPLIAILQDRLAKTKEYLSKKSLPPLPDELKNPLNIAEKTVAQKAEVESYEDSLRFRLRQYELEKDNAGWLEGEGMYHITQFQDEDDFVDVEAFETAFGEELPDGLKTEIDQDRYIRSRIEEENLHIIKLRSGLPQVLRHKFLKEEEEKVQLIPDYQRGKIQQKLEDRDLLVTTPSKLLVTHIDNFIEHTEFLVKEGKISPDRAGKIITVIQY